MSVYVVLRQPPSGGAEPVGVYSTDEAATDAMNEIARREPAMSFEFFEVDLDGDPIGADKIHPLGWAMSGPNE